MTFSDLNNMDAKEIIPGFRGKFVHSEKATVAFWDIDAGAVLPEHAHIQEQITSVLEGQFELTVAGETRIVGAGGTAVIPSNVLHAGQALTACRLMDVFCPCRDDYR